MNNHIPYNQYNVPDGSHVVLSPDTMEVVKNKTQYIHVLKIAAATDDLYFGFIPPVDRSTCDHASPCNCFNS